MHTYIRTYIHTYILVHTYIHTYIHGCIHIVIMGSYDEAKVCELVGQFIFHQLSKLVGVKNIGFYRDDGGHPRKRLGSYLREYKEKDYKAISPALTAETTLSKPIFSISSST